MRHHRLLPAAIVLAVALAPTIALADVTISAHMNQSEEVGPTGSTGIANGTVTLVGGVDGVQDTLIVNLTYSSLVASGSGTSAAHIHGPAVRGANAGIMIPLTILSGTRSGTISQTVPITASQRSTILLGQSYLNIHSGTFPNGEIRGQLDSLPATSGSKLPATSNAGLIVLMLALAGSAAAFLASRRARA